MDLNSEISSILEIYKGLRYDSQTNCLIGELFISSNDSYQVKIDLSPYPTYFPKVEETGERIPKKADRHIYMDSGHCCFTTTAIAQILLKTKIKSLSHFFKFIVIPYFENNSFFEINKRYSKGEFKHGIEGVLEGYKDILDVNDNYKIVKIIYNRITNTNQPSAKCYCGSTKSLKQCNNGRHFKKYNNFKLIPIPVLGSDFEKIIEYLKK